MQIEPLYLCLSTARNKMAVVGRHNPRSRSTDPPTMT